MPPKAFRFEAVITRRSWNDYTFMVVEIPSDLVAKLPGKGYHRVAATLGPVDVKCALTPDGEGGYYILISKKLHQRLGVSVGDAFPAQYVLEPRDSVHVPPEIEAALKEMPHTARYWEELTPGRKRGLSHMVSSAVRPETRERRAREVLQSLLPMRFSPLSDPIKPEKARVRRPPEDDDAPRLRRVRPRDDDEDAE